ncbi:MAG: hypothetical protein HQL37_06950 [Alphaproteobacteria bacterium]|nr:hypothetical protein [Alphaproteobacteria bacterium]
MSDTLNAESTTDTTPADAPIPLATDADFAAAETELRQVLLKANTGDRDMDGPEFKALCDRWQALHGAIINAEPLSPFQAAVILRAGVLCETNGIAGPNCVEAEHLVAIRNVAGLLSDLADDPDDTAIRDDALYNPAFEMALAAMQLAGTTKAKRKAKYRAALLSIQDDLDTLTADVEPLPYVLTSLAQRQKNESAKISLNWLAKTIEEIGVRVREVNWAISANYRHAVYGRNAARDKSYMGYPTVPLKPAPERPFPTFGNEQATVA